MRKILLSMMAATAITAVAQDAPSLTADLQEVYLWNYTTTAWKDYQTNEQTINISAANLTENISWTMASSGKAKGDYLANSTRFELGNLGQYETNSGAIYIRVTSKVAGTYEDVIVIKSGDLEVNIPVTLQVAGTEGDGYWDETDFCPLTVADANAIHAVMPAGASYCTDQTHKFDTFGGDYGERYFRGIVTEVTSANTFVLKDAADASESLTVLAAELPENVSVGMGDEVTLYGDVCDADGVCAVQNGHVTNVVAGEAPAAGPAVTMEEVSVESTAMTLTFTPNDATGHYYCCLFGEGEFEAQYNMFGAWMGFQEYGDMVKAWGFDCEGVQTKDWTGLTPFTNYEIWVQPTDAVGNYGELQCFTVTTIGKGGTGVAEISIEIGQFGGDAENGFWQQVIYTPNDQTAVFFDLICTEEFYQENGAEGVIAYLKAEDDPSDPYYTYFAQFETDNAIWTAEEGTTYHACAIGKNANGEWGQLTDVVFTTPGTSVALEHVEAQPAVDAPAYNVMGQRVEGKQGLVIRARRVELAK